MLRAKLYFDLHKYCVLSDLTQNWNKPFTVTQEEVLDDEMISLVIDAGDQQAAFKTRLEASPEITHVEELDGTRLLLTKRSCGALPIIRSNHGMLQGVDKVNGSQRVFDVVVLRREDLKAIVRELREIGTVRLGKLTPYHDRTVSLSRRQAEVVELALQEGYFDWPRRIDAQTLAERLDISHSTMLEHLRKAEKKLLEEVLSGPTAPRVSSPREREFMLNDATEAT